MAQIPDAAAASLALRLPVCMLYTSICICIKQLMKKLCIMFMNPKLMLMKKMIENFSLLCHRNIILAPVSGSNLFHLDRYDTARDTHYNLPNHHKRTYKLQISSII